MERILIPMDGSETAEAALHFVEKMLSSLVPQNKLEVILFQAISEPFHEDVIGERKVYRYAREEIEPLKEKALEYLNKAGETLRKMGIAVSCKINVSSAEVTEEIIRAEEETDADLVVMSTHGRGATPLWPLGNVAYQVMRNSSCPVLVVRAKKRSKGS